MYVYYCPHKTSVNDAEYSKNRDPQTVKKKSNQFQSTTDHLSVHRHCRNTPYSDVVQRFPVPDDKVVWDIHFPDYRPIEYTAEKIQKNPKADPIDPLPINRFNQIDSNIDRRSSTGLYAVEHQTNRPKNPFGRTGIKGRGRLYYWGPNHAGDCIVTRWSRDKNGSIQYRRSQSQETPKPLLEFVAIRRKDTQEWALPGGMVDASEDVSQTVRREFKEEAARDGIETKLIDQLFSDGQQVYRGYMDDPRNTDNAWIETVAIHFHDHDGTLTKDLRLNAGDDADKSVWCAIDRNMELYAGHKEILHRVVRNLNAFW